MPFYDIKITPQKENNIAQILIHLNDTHWEEHQKLHQKIEDSIPAQHLLKKELSDQNSLLLEITYGQLEEISRSLEDIFSSDGQLTLSSKQIYILKLGGWFDF